LSAVVNPRNIAFTEAIRARFLRPRASTGVARHDDGRARGDPAARDDDIRGDAGRKPRRERTRGHGRRCGRGRSRRGGHHAFDRVELAPGPVGLDGPVIASPREARAKPSRRGAATLCTSRPSHAAPPAWIASAASPPRHDGPRSPASSPSQGFASNASRASEANCRRHITITMPVVLSASGSGPRNQPR